MAMSKKRLLAVVIISGLLTSIVFGAILVNLGEANPGSVASPPAPSILIQSPNKNETYTTNALPLIFRVDASVGTTYSSIYGSNTKGSSPNPFTVSYYLDGGLMGYFDKGTAPVLVSRTLTSLSEGIHKIEVSATSPSFFPTQASRSVYFTVDSKPPSILLPSLSNNVLTFHTNEETSEVCCSIDGKANGTVTSLFQQTDNQSAISMMAPIKVTGNVDSSGLSEGSHTIEIYANDAAGNVGNSDLVQFTISAVISSPTPSITQNPNSSPSPTSEPTIEPTSTPKPQTGFLDTNLPTEYGYIIVAVLVVAVVGGLSLLYLKKLSKQKVND
jgi:hypothetical protein